MSFADLPHIEGDYTEIVYDLDHRNNSIIFNGHGMIQNHDGEIGYANFGLFSINETHFDDACHLCMLPSFEDSVIWGMSFSDPERNEKLADLFVKTGRIEV